MRIVLVVVFLLSFIFSCKQSLFAGDPNVEGPVSEDGKKDKIYTFNDIEQIAAKFYNKAQQDYRVYRGEMDFFSIPDCIELIKNPEIGNCQGNNPSSPYGLFCFPGVEGEYIDPDENFKTGDEIRPGSELGDEKLYSGWRLRQDEAILYIGLTPPKSRYFSFRSYLFSRSLTNSGKIGKAFTRLVARKADKIPDRFVIFASLGDSHNNLTLSTTGTIDNPYNQITVLLVTANKNIEKRLKEMVTSILIKEGLNADIINVDQISTQIAAPKPIAMGYSRDADVFTMLLRVDLFANENDKEEYTANPPAKIFRLVPKSEVTSNPHPQPKLRSRQHPHNEDTLKRSLKRMTKAVVSRYRNFDRSHRPQVRRFIKPKLEGLRCIKKSTPCLGDNRDAYTIRLANLIILARVRGVLSLLLV